MSLLLQDMELIRQVTYRYFRCVDTGDFAGLERCFAPCASVSFIGGSYRFECEGRDKIVEALKSILHAGIASMHTAHHPEITLTGAGTAEGIWYLTDWAINLETKTVTHGACLARNRYRKAFGEWRIEHYGYTRIYEQVEVLERLPNITAHALGQAWRGAGAGRPQK